MAKKVALDDDLKNMKDDLEAQGYQVVSLNSQNIKDVTAVITSGMDINFMQLENIQTNAQVINARGKSTQEVLQALNDTL